MLWFSSGHVWTWELDYTESWAQKNSCFWTVVLEKTLESPLDCKEIQPDHPKGNQPWIFIGRTDAETESSSTLATWCKELTHWKRSWYWEDWRQKEKGWQSMRWLDSITDSMNVNLRQLWAIVRRRQWHPTPVLLPGKSHGRRSLEGCSPWGC